MYDLYSQLAFFIDSRRKMFPEDNDILILSRISKDNRSLCAPLYPCTRCLCIFLKCVNPVGGKPVAKGSVSVGCLVGRRSERADAVLALYITKVMRSWTVPCRNGPRAQYHHKQNASLSDGCSDEQAADTPLPLLLLSIEDNRIQRVLGHGFLHLHSRNWGGSIEDVTWQEARA